MDPIYEAYRMSSTKNNLETSKGVYRDIQKFVNSKSKELGVKSAGVFYDSSDLKYVDLQKIGRTYTKTVGSNSLGVAVIEDRGTPSKGIQIIGVLGTNSKYNASQFYMKVKQAGDIEKALLTWISGIKPIPSASDVNDPIKNRPNRRM